MTESEKELWNLINSFEIDDEHSVFPFSERLARDNNWKLEFSIRTIAEYKKFIFLICITDHPLTPSDAVDQVWHLHLLYTQSYWKEFMPLIGREIHHGPTKGGNEERTKYTNCYGMLKTRYVEVFGEEFPKDIWPSDKIRFGEINFVRVNLHRNWVFPKKRRR
ncbi:MAG: hypothetical protein ACJA1C_001328 [Crocinitomicaceae bacterium]|jgi:hypothetical protein